MEHGKIMEYLQGSKSECFNPLNSSATSNQKRLEVHHQKQTADRSRVWNPAIFSSWSSSPSSKSDHRQLRFTGVGVGTETAWGAVLRWVSRIVCGGNLSQEVLIESSLEVETENMKKKVI